MTVNSYVYANCPFCEICMKSKVEWIQRIMEDPKGECNMREGK